MHEKAIRLGFIITLFFCLGFAIIHFLMLQRVLSILYSSVLFLMT